MSCLALTVVLRVLTAQTESTDSPLVQPEPLEPAAAIDPDHAGGGDVRAQRGTERPSNTSAWVTGGAIAWTPLGAGAGLLIGGASSHWGCHDLGAHLGAGTAIGAVLAAGLGATLGVLASRGWRAARFGVFVPAIIDGVILVLSGLALVAFHYG